MFGSEKNKFLPATWEEMLSRGWEEIDIVLVTGDAYVDHPSFGVAMIGRWLESHGYKVAILFQPRHHNAEDFKRFGKPRLFYGITAGNLDSIVSNYTGNAKVRDTDTFSKDGNPYFNKYKKKSERRRPDRATIRYANLAKSAFNDVPVILGGLEASLRRFVHYDFQQKKLRASILTDAKADLLVYGMGERAVLNIARLLETGKDLKGIDGTCERLTEKEVSVRGFPDTTLILPSFEDIKNDTSLFMYSEQNVDSHARSLSEIPILQKQQAIWVLQNKPALPLNKNELDKLYALPFVRTPHPNSGDIPAYRMIRHSVTIVRGCSGNCSFCAITRHQGPVVTCRNKKSILNEVKVISEMPDFTGTITDIGGPTANLYGTSCGIQSCKKHDCLYPKVCKNLKIDEKVFINLLDEVSALEKVKHCHVSSGLRMELLLKTPHLLEKIITKHTPGRIKIAPEHTEKEVLKLMHKEGPDLLPKFVKTCRDIAKKNQKEVNFATYFISAHPGCMVRDMKQLAQKIKKSGLKVRQFQDFTATPGTLSTAMYVTGLARESLKKIHVPRGDSERKAQRVELEKIMKKNNKNIRDVNR